MWTLLPRARHFQHFSLAFSHKLYNVRHSIKSAFLFEKHCNTSYVFLICQFINFRWIFCLKIGKNWNTERLSFLGEVFHCSWIPIFWPHWNLPRTILKKMSLKSFLEYHFYFHISAIVYWMLYKSFRNSNVTTTESKLS